MYQTVDYGDVAHEAFDSPKKPQRQNSGESDTDFSGNANDEDNETSEGESDEGKERQKANRKSYVIHPQGGCKT